MDKYEVIGMLGEGSFGRVYKAKQLTSSEIVALKVIGKRGKSTKEIKGLRRECEIQRYLHHPNIIKMLDSFETENEIVVITEFVPEELTAILGKEGFLSEERVQTIVWDLVSALYYLHSHRVLHRDLKPQNILVDLQGKSKLCDFGFARNMSTGTHVLTSIKGTPLYMAPELIDEHPYDHTADLWSLGCITYELLVGYPPFHTTSILHLVQKIRHNEINFPSDTISDTCISFLKGLLQKDPTKRMSWPEILNHSFVKGHVLILKDAPSKPLTRLLSMDTLHAKEKQRKSLTAKTQTKLPTYKSIKNVLPAAKPKLGATKKTASNETLESQSKNKENHNLEERLSNLCLQNCESASCSGAHESTESSKECQGCLLHSNKGSSVEVNSSPVLLKIEDNLNLFEDSTPIENDEWIVFLQRTIAEVMAGELTSVNQPNLANISVTPLRNLNASSKVISYVVKLFTLPLAMSGISDQVLKEIKKVYIDIKLIANLVYASKLLMRHKHSQSSSSTTPASFILATTSSENTESVSSLSDEDVDAIENIYLLLCYLVYCDVEFLSQFCDSIAVLCMDHIFVTFLQLTNIRSRIVTDLLAILTRVLQQFPDYSELIHQIIYTDEARNVDFVHMLKHSSSILRERSCCFILFLGHDSPEILKLIWSGPLRDTLEALVYDSIENVRNAAEAAVDELTCLPFYNSTSISYEAC